ncbi:putative enzyme related to lactoylglutathione lyase [Herbihabitans rhizosphaerae]|uniref:Putative enzyme related to lactoylglutathione lyase n=1 Tax=Herbihabitans rhizosphaerae TaxID=1872711 RepID=A0A4Q7KLP1_9PSEU|nr:VOC family protein [Herbihabitans rhizosphaerae]RZS36471.1 putative enzyme related to lactoylglutathione lyase [Herbihabitans rhizosphaerae]
MFSGSKAFSGFAVPDTAVAKKFYTEVLGLDVDDSEMGILQLNIAGDTTIVVYPKENHEPAGFTVLNFPVEDIDAAIEKLTGRGVELLRYEGFGQDDKGVVRKSDENPGPAIAWFTDPAGNVFSVMEL